jgi:hypothetical protein
MKRRRNPIKGWSGRLAWAISVIVGGLLAIPAAAEGNFALMVVILGLAIPLCWLAAGASSRILVGVTCIALGVAMVYGALWVTMVSVIAASLAAAIQVNSLNWAWVRSLSMGGVLFAWSQVNFDTNRTAVLGTLALITIVIPVIVSGFARRRHGHRRRILVLGVSYLAVVVLGLTATAVGVVRAQVPARAAIDAMSGLETHLLAGNFLEAQSVVDSAVILLAEVNEELNRPWMRVAVLVPVVSSNLRYINAMSTMAEAELDVVSQALGLTDLSSLRAKENTVDLFALKRLDRPLDLVYNSLQRIRRLLNDRGRTWVVPPITAGVVRASEELDEQIQNLEAVREGLEVAQTALGADRPMRYFVAFTTPAESRGFGGFMGAWAEMLFQNGEVSVVRKAGTGALEGGPTPPSQRTLDPDSPILANYGRYGFNSGPEGRIQVSAWSNITMPPHFPTVADAIRQLYPQSGGVELDGVIVMDPFVMQSLIGLSGEVYIPELGLTLDGSNTTSFLTSQMYELREETAAGKDELIALVGEVAIRSAINSGLQQPIELARLLGRHGRERRFAIWLEGEVDFLAKVAVDGALPRPDGRDGFTMFIQNAAPNKADIYLDRSYEHRYVADLVTGAISGTTRITITNRLNPDGVAPVVTGGIYGDPPGSARLLLSFLTRLNIDDAQVEGQPLPLSRSVEEGWQRWLTGVVVPPNGASVTVTLKLSGRQVPGEFAFLAIPQPLVTPERIRLEVIGSDGSSLIDIDEDLHEVTTYSLTAGK